MAIASCPVSNNKVYRVRAMDFGDDRAGAGNNDFCSISESTCRLHQSPATKNRTGYGDYVYCVFVLLITQRSCINETGRFFGILGSVCFRNAGAAAPLRLLSLSILALFSLMFAAYVSGLFCCILGESEAKEAKYWSAMRTSVPPCLRGKNVLCLSGKSFGRRSRSEL